MKHSLFSVRFMVKQIDFVLPNKIECSDISNAERKSMILFKKNQALDLSNMKLNVRVNGLKKHGFPHSYICILCKNDVRKFQLGKMELLRKSGVFPIRNYELY